tara:strand:+ start:127 stop:591 length:465 start_codon:yes stop_codon:yes gene_type:complete
VASNKQKPLMASVTIDVDFNRIPHLVRAMMKEEEEKIKHLASGFREEVVESLKPGQPSGYAQKLNVDKALRRLTEFRESLASVDAQLEQHYNLLLAYYRRENGELLEDKKPEPQTEEVSSEPVTEEEFKEQLASAEKFNEFVQKMEDPEEEDEQ